MRDGLAASMRAGLRPCTTGRLTTARAEVRLVPGAQDCLDYMNPLPEAQQQTRDMWAALASASRRLASARVAGGGAVGGASKRAAAGRAAEVSAGSNGSLGSGGMGGHGRVRSAPAAPGARPVPLKRLQPVPW
jgi:hypothetical protein